MFFLCDSLEATTECHVKKHVALVYCFLWFDKIDCSSLSIENTDLVRIRLTWTCEIWRPGMGTLFEQWHWARPVCSRNLFFLLKEVESNQIVRIGIEVCILASS